MPVLAFLTALGAAATVRRLIAMLGKSGSGEVPDGAASGATHLAIALAMLVMIFPAIGDVSMVRTLRRNETLYHRNFQRLVGEIPDSRAIVFVRYRPNHTAHFSLVRNVPNLDKARVWVVYDRGADDARLLRLAPDRVPYLYDDARLAIVPLNDSSKSGIRVGS